MPALAPRALLLSIGLLGLLAAGCGDGGGAGPDGGRASDGDVDLGTPADVGQGADGGDQGVGPSDGGFDDAEADAMVPLEATLAADAASAPLGELLLDVSEPVNLVFRNAGESESGILTTSLLGDATFTIESDSCDGGTLLGGAMCVVRVIARSSVAASSTAIVRVSGSPGGVAETTLTATYVTPFALSLDDDDHDFGPLLVGASASKIFRVTNEGGQTSPALGALSAGNAAFAITLDGCSGASLLPGEHCEFTIVFTPVSPGAVSSSTPVSAGGASLAVDARGVGQAPASLRFDASLPSFAQTLLGSTSATITYTLTNEGGVESGPLETSLAGSDATDFEVVSDECDGATVQPADDCAIVVRFRPTSGRGQKQASVSASGTPGGAASATLSGVALANAQLTESDGPHHFGIEPVGGVSASHEFLVSNVGDVPSGPVTVTLGGANPDQFAIESGGCAAPVAGESGCSVFVTFRPTRYGPASATVQVTSTPGGAVGFAVSGTGEEFLALTVTTPLNGGGSGSVSGAGLGCPSGACQVFVSRTTMNPSVTLTAAAASSSNFAGWSGACAGFGTATECTLELNAPSTSVGAAFDLKVYRVVLLPSAIDGAQGEVHGTTMPDAGTDIDCGATCEIEVTHGTVIELVSTPKSGAFSGGFDGGCVSTSRRCTFTVTEDTEVSTMFTPANRTFTTPLTYTVAETKAFATDTSSEVARMLSGADAICRSLGGSSEFFAFLGAPGVSPYTRLPGAPRGFVRADGRPFKGELSHTSPTYYPPSLDQTGAAISNVVSSQVWSGAGVNGVTSASTTCGSWTGSGLVAVGPYEGVGNTWSSNASASCNPTTRHHFVCLEARYRADVSPGPVPAGGRVAFVTTAVFNPATGLAGADALCDAEASSLPGSFRAMLATSAASMASRFSQDARPIYRPDGVLVAADAAALLGPTLPLTPIAVDAAALPVQALVWVGSSSPMTPGDTTTTCHTVETGSWSTTSGSVNGRLGFSSQRDTMLASAWFPCSWASGHVYCLEE